MIANNFITGGVPDKTVENNHYRQHTGKQVDGQEINIFSIQHNQKIKPKLSECLSQATVF